jgi:uncharacterized protein (TIGR03067 family)
MRLMKHLALAVLAVGLFGAAARADDLEGTWKIESGVRNGEKVDKDKLDPVTVEVTKDKITLTDKKNDSKFVMTYKTKEGKPTGIDITIVEGPVKDVSAKGIVEVKGDTMKLCYHPMGGDAPKTFESKADSQLHFFTLKREKKQ